jgi:hypothetical protein
MNRTTIGVAVSILIMSAVTSIVAAQERIPGADEFNNGPRSHLGTGSATQKNTPPDRIPGSDEFNNGPRSHNTPALVTPAPSSSLAQMSVDWQLAQDRRGHPKIDGYVENHDGVPVNGVELEVDRLDENGGAVSKDVLHLNDVIPSHGRAYFEAPVPAPDAHYRVSVIGAETVEGH